MQNDMQLLEQEYQQIMSIYDMTEDLIQTAELANLEGKANEHLDVIEPLANQIADSNDVLCEEFIEVAGQQEKNSKRRSRIEGALRKVYTAIDAFHAQSQNVCVSAATGTMTAINVIKRQVEDIIAIFMNYIDISLDRIMQKQHVDELKETHKKISSMLFQAERQTGFEMGA